MMSRKTIARWSLLGSLLLLVPAWQEPGPQAQSGQKGLVEQVEAVIRADEYRISSWGIAVADAGTGEMIYALNPDQLFLPGSVTKLFSGAAALVALGADHRFVTPLHRRGEIGPDGTLDGDLILRGSGDPDLSGRTNAAGKLEFTNRDHTYAGLYAAQGTTAELTKTEALAGIDHLARQVAAAGIRKIKDVLIDERLFERHQSGGSPPFQVSPVVINDHLIDLTVSPGEQVGDSARVEWRPATSYLQFEREVRTVAAGQATLVSVQRLAPRRYSVRGQIALDKPPTVRVVEVDDPAEFARAVLIERLQAHGVSVTGSIEALPSPAALPSPGEYERLPIVASLASAPFAESLKVILKVSHNNHAHMLPLLLGARTGSRSHAGGMRAQGEVLRQLGLDIASFSLGDGEGGDQANQVSPRATIQLLRLMAAHPQARAFRDSLPILGVDGTLAEAVPPTSPARGKVFAKTGTYVLNDPHNGRLLLRAKALGGYAKGASGRPLLFALFLNNVPLTSSAESNRHGATLGKLAEIIQQSL